MNINIIFESMQKRIWDRREQIYLVAILCGVVLTVVLMYYRAFFGTELTDEAFYVSEAKEMLFGNVPFAYNNSFIALGFAFLLIAIEWVYRLFVPNLEGVVLFTRLCFVTYEILTCGVIFHILQKKTKKSNALLLSGLLLPTVGYLPNFSYNTIPSFTLLLAGCILYDVLEQEAKHKKCLLAVAGFITGIACFANPGWGGALICFAVLIVFREREKKYKLKSLLIFGVGVLAELLVVVIPICIQTSFVELWYGFYRMFINPIPADSMNPYKTWAGVIYSFIGPLRQWVMIFVPTVLFVFLCSQRYIFEEGIKLTKRKCFVLAITVGMFVHMLFLAYQGWGADTRSLWGFSAFCYMIVFLIVGIYKDERLILYLGLYPPMYAVAVIILVSYGATIERFVHAFTIVIPMLYVLLKYQVELVRIVATIITVVFIVSLGYADFHYVYGDDNFHDLTYRVESGVYKGLYTTEARSEDLPELEEYLNSIIGEDEAYAFRDLVPSAYLMVHKGTMCEMSTWEILQHAHHRNSPAPLFDYYRRRDMIPEKIIYIDFGIDENLSIVESDYRYNDWVNAYYDLVEDIDLNDTFFRVMVYQYNGTFDGNYQYWIDKYWELVK